MAYIKQGFVDTTYDGQYALSEHAYAHDSDIIGDSGIYATVRTKDGRPWDGKSNTNIDAVFIYTTKGYGELDLEVVRLSGVAKNTYGFDSNSAYQVPTVIGSETVTISNIPVFTDEESRNKYIQTGDWSGATNKDDLLAPSTETRCYVDTSKPPNIKLVFDLAETDKESDKEIPTNIYVRMWKCKDYGDVVGGAQILNTFYSFGGSQSYTWGVIEFNAGGNVKDLAIEVDTHGDFTSSVIAYIADNGECMPQTKTTNGKNSIICIIGTGENDDGYIDVDNDSNATDENTVTNTTNLLTTTFKMSAIQLKALSNFLWADDFMQNIKLLNNSPIENIVSLKALPVSYPISAISDVVLGNVDSGVDATPVTTNYIKKTIGSIAVPHLRNFFADYEQAKVSVYLPLIGTFTDLDPKEVIGYTVTLKYVFDCITGDVLAMIFNNRDNAENLMGTYKGNCGIDIPLTSTNRAQVEAGYITDAVSAITSLATKNPSGIVNAGLNAVTRENTTKSSGSVSGVTAQGLPNTAYLTISNANCQGYSETFCHTYGRPCMISHKLSSLKGFTQCDSSADLSGISCTDTERERLREIISSGFYL